MSVITSGKTFANGEQLTADKLNQVITAATFNATEAVDNSTTQIDGSGAIVVRDGGISTAKLVDSSVTKAKIEDVADMKVLGNTSGSDSAPQEVSVLDEDDMSSDSATSLATQQSVKAYVDGGGNGSIAGPTGVTVDTCGTALIAGGLVMKYGSGSSTLDTSESFSFDSAFPNNCFIVLIAGASAHLSADSFSASGFTINRNDSIDGNRGFRFIAIGN